MPLTDAQLVTVSEITLETLEDVESLAENLTAEQVSSIQADITTWATIRDSHVKLSGGSSGVNFSNSRKRDAIRVRVRNALGLDPSTETGSVAVEHQWAW